MFHVSWPCLSRLTEYVPEIRGLELLQPVWLVKVSDNFHVLTAMHEKPPSTTWEEIVARVFSVLESKKPVDPHDGHTAVFHNVRICQHLRL